MSPVFGTTCNELNLGIRVTTSSRTDTAREEAGIMILARSIL